MVGILWLSGMETVYSLVSLGLWNGPVQLKSPLPFIPEVLCAVVLSICSHRCAQMWSTPTPFALEDICTLMHFMKIIFDFSHFFPHPEAGRLPYVTYQGSWPP